MGVHTPHIYRVCAHFFGEHVWGEAKKLKIFWPVFSPVQAILSTNILFCELKPHAKFYNPTITASGEK